MIALRCTCGKKLQVPDRMAGRTGKCPACGEPVPVPRAGFVDDEGETVASDNSPLELGEDPAPKSRVPAVASAAPAAAAARRKGGPAGPTIPCPRCGKAYGTEAIFCPLCAVDLRTGHPLAGVVPGHMSAPRPVRADSAFGLFIRHPVVRLVLGGLLLAAALFAIWHFMVRGQL
ncbi:MAG: hypothetical protein FD180_1542 [Planctomycetota bacterium]|nr:MAG: hypothetical protein FD180_1542 [Planctomycetota bacterium]